MKEPEYEVDFMPTCHQYMVAHIPMSYLDKKGAKDLVETLGPPGQEGWLLCQIVPNPLTGEATVVMARTGIKRPKESKLVTPNGPRIVK